MMDDSYRSFTNLVQKITVYETKETLYILGSDEAERIFRILEISRNDRTELVIYDSKKTYTSKEASDYINKTTQAGKRRLKKIESGYTLAGFVRFTEGYYLILVTSRRKVAMIGSHMIYKVEGTAMIYITTDKATKPEEQRYAKLFENVDFSNNFYFSYTYDLTHSLQYNQTTIKKTNDPTASPSECLYPQARQRPLKQFVWNLYLLEPIRDLVHDDWLVYLTHGFLSQVDMIVFGRHLYITLISRRSNQYAGTRFMKRGCNPLGFVANEVETEQIVHDASQTSLDATAFTSFVQLRGSIPLYWSQDLTKAMSKPPISLDFTDPYGRIASSHFRQLYRRYGAPIIVLSLVKRRERRRRESVLWDELVKAIQYLNQFLKDEHRIRYVAFDMARSNRKKGVNVLAHLDDISQRCIGKTGFYTKNCVGLEDRKQHGVIRTNCVDCLDRTNTAQFAVGKHALGLQLHALGVTPTQELFFDTDCVSMLEALYEDLGDTVALQYGGSNLVHRVQTYRKTDLLSAHSNDILQNLARYYKNSFTDSEKQQAFNVFLGVYRPFIESVALWDLPSDVYLHTRVEQPKFDYCEWLDKRIVSTLPKPYDEEHKQFHLVLSETPISADVGFDHIYRVNELTHLDSLFYMTMVNSTKTFAGRPIAVDPNMYSLSPFEVRKTVRWTKILNQAAPSFSDVAKDLENSVFLTGTTTEDPDSSSSEESDIECKLSSEEEEVKEEVKTPYALITFNDVTEDPCTNYDVDTKFTLQTNSKAYKHYQKFADQVNTASDTPKDTIASDTPKDTVCEQDISIICKSIFPLDSEYEVIPPTVKKEARNLYKQMVTIGRHGAKSVPQANRVVYEKYVQQLRQ